MGGTDPIYRKDSTLKNIVGMGIYSPSWMRADYPDLPAVGRFESKSFEPDKWSPAYNLAAFANRLPDDTFWAARQVMAFSDEDIRAIAQTAQYSDQKAERWIADSLIDRRDRIGRTYFTRVLPLVDFAVRGAGELVFTDVARPAWVRAVPPIQGGVVDVRQSDGQADDAHRVEWRCTGAPPRRTLPRAATCWRW